MSAEIIIAGLSLLGTLAGTAGGIIVSGKLVNYRIEQLEKKVEKHNNLITRTFRLEQAVALLDERVRVANHRISGLENFSQIERQYRQNQVEGKVQKEVCCQYQDITGSDKPIFHYGFIINSWTICDWKPLHPVKNTKFEAN